MELSYREVPLAPIAARGLGQVYKKFYYGDTGSFLSHFVFKFPGEVDMVRVPGSFVRAGQWAIGDPAETAAGVAFLHACDGAHVRPYAEYAAAFIAEVERRGWKDVPLSPKMLKALHYHFSDDVHHRPFTTDYAVMHEMDWRGWTWHILENLLYTRHQPIAVGGRNE